MALLERWQRRINLVGRSTLADPWRRHVLDSAQLVPLIPAEARTIVDLGSGAGFPGLVLAILTGLDTHLIDSDARKGAFLREVIRVTGAPATVVTARIEGVVGLTADVVTARALAPLPRLLDLAAPLLSPRGQCLFLKGRDAAAELTESEKRWIMRVERVPSVSDPSGTVLSLRDLQHRHADPPS